MRGAHLAEMLPQLVAERLEGQVPHVEPGAAAARAVARNALKPSSPPLSVRLACRGARMGNAPKHACNAVWMTARIPRAPGRRRHRSKSETYSSRAEKETRQKLCKVVM